MRKFTGLCIAIVLGISGCSARIETQIPITSTSTITILVTQPELTSTSTANIKPTSTNTPIPTETPISVGSPLGEYSIDALIDMISNPYIPPQNGSDDPHQGVDFSVVDPELVIALKGSPVKSILKGEVVSVIYNRFPYGNAIMVETAIKELPQSWQNRLGGIVKPEPFGLSTNLTCPKGWDSSRDATEDLSLFVLYAHMDDLSDIDVGQIVESGDHLGIVGDSGNALAPHLHVEMRYGYSGSISGSMAHYDVTASQEEMLNYCKWRVSGLFRLVDPMTLLFTKP